MTPTVARFVLKHVAFLRDVLDRPANERPYVLVALGFPEEGCRVPDLERKPLEEILTVV